MNELVLSLEARSSDMIMPHATHGAMMTTDHVLS